jgi:hypothetical protein
VVSIHFIPVFRSSCFAVLHLRLGISGSTCLGNQCVGGLRRVPSCYWFPYCESGPRLRYEIEKIAVVLNG